MIRLRKHAWATPALLLGVPLLLRLWALLDLRQDLLFRLLVVDARTYHDTAARMAAGTFPWREPFWQPPFYPMFLAFVYKIFGPHPDAARAVQALLGSISCLLIFRLGERFFSRRAAWISWGIAALYGPLIYFELQILSAGPAIFLLLVALERLTADLRPREAAVAGTALGLASITVATMLTLVPVCALWLFSAGRSTGSKVAPHRGGRAVLLFLGAALLPVLIATAYNLRVGGEPIVVSYNGGINFWIGNNPEYDRTVAIRPGRAWVALVNEPLRAGAKTPLSSSQWFLGRSLDWIRAHPGDWLRLLGYKLRLFLRGDEIARNQEIYPFRAGSPVLRLLLWVHGLAFPFGLLLPTAGAGMFLALRRKQHGAHPDRNRPGAGQRPGLGLLAVVAGVYAAAVVLFFVTSRYRLPVVPLLILFAVGGTARAISRLRRGHPESLVLPAAVFGALLLGAHVKVPAMPERFGSDTYSDLGTFYTEQKQPDEAAAAYETALSLNPGNLEAVHNLGVLALSARRLDQGAEELFQRVLRSYPDDANALVNLGNVRWYRNDVYGAGGDYLRASRIDPENQSAKQNLVGMEGIADRLEATELARDSAVFLSRLEAAAVADPSNEFLSGRLSALRLRGSGSTDRTRR